jgi:hypothetical protein
MLTVRVIWDDGAKQFVRIHEDSLTHELEEQLRIDYTNTTRAQIEIDGIVLQDDLGLVLAGNAPIKQVLSHLSIVHATVTTKKTRDAPEVSANSF